MGFFSREPAIVSFVLDLNYTDKIAHILLYITKCWLPPSQICRQACHTSYIAPTSLRDKTCYVFVAFYKHYSMYPLTHSWPILWKLQSLTGPLHSPKYILCLQLDTFAMCPIFVCMYVCIYIYVCVCVFITQILYLEHHSIYNKSLCSSPQKIQIT